MGTATAIAMLLKRLAQTPPALCRAASNGASQEWARARPFSEVPGPRPAPIVGNVWRFLPVIGEFSSFDLLLIQKQMHERYGNIVKLEGILNKPAWVLVSDPNDIEKLYRNEGQWPVRPGVDSLGYYRNVHRKDVYQGVGGLAAVHGKEWAEFRKRVNQPMMQPRSVRLYASTIDEVAIEMTNRMIRLRDSRQEMPADFINELYKWALESISVVALDARLGCLADSLPPDSKQQQLIDSVQTMFDSLFQLDLKPSPWKYISTPAWRRFVRSMDHIHKITMEYVQRAMERIKARPADQQGELSILERLLLSNDDPRIAIVMALDMMVGGIDTTSNAVAALLYYLAKNPDKQEKLYEELRAATPESALQPLSSTEGLKYLRACVKESMRLKPIAPSTARTVTADNLVLGNYQIPEGVDVMTSNMLLATSEQHFPGADEFRPERWLKRPDGSSEAQDSHPFIVMPFGFGPRTCIGKRFAELEIEMLVARIVRRFRVEYHHGEAEWTMALLHCISSPLRFRIIDREH